MNPPKISPSPFLKWAGGKKGIVDTLKHYVPWNFHAYHEPFLGGGALFFALKNSGLLDGKEVFLSDINDELINTYRVVRDSPNELIEVLQDFSKEHSKSFYYRVRAWDKEPNFKRKDPVQRAARFVYLNKTCYNGLYRVNAKGHFNVPFGYHKNPNICDRDRIYRASEALRGAHLYVSCYTKTLQKAQEGDFVYLDPPYLSFGQNDSFCAYGHKPFLLSEQTRLRDFFDRLDQKGVFVLQSNIEHPFIRDLYKKYEIQKVYKTHKINSDPKGRKRRVEVLISNKGKNWI